MIQQTLYQSQWIVSAEQAKQIIDEDATILDSRNVLIWLTGHIPEAIHFSWKQFTQPSFQKGKLLENPKILEGKLRKLGIFNNKPVIVIGNPTFPCYFGEDGRIVWMLRTLGHQFTAFVDGGEAALTKIGLPITLDITKPPLGDFVIKTNNLWTMEKEEIQNNILTQNLSNLKIIDTRSPQEFAGATPYGEKRGGHIPNAVNFHFKNLLDEQGYLLPSEEIIAKLKNLEITTDTPIVTYCTGGVRSGFFVAVLTKLGFTNVKNYAGSMWEWSAAVAYQYPLQKIL
ncbi:MAG: rhodanese-like domain-containing protein [Coleofasciculaceae cyanobacterium]